jgi:protocatechuate 3,4-dioxygenase alpha subunit
MKLIPTASQTVGPFFCLGLEHLCTPRVSPAENAEIVTVSGKVLDGEGMAVPDAVLEIWHADAEGRFAEKTHESGRPVCFTRVMTDDTGRFQFTIPKPGAVACAPELNQAPHLAVLVFARGLLRHLITRMYFSDSPVNASDSLLQMIPAERRGTLIARAVADDAHLYEWNVVLQGSDETVFFAW